ncbi:long-chain fatty acid--CoA ligase [Carbonactinospora thermoautotrophica]|uniref:AMP-dependent synthetase/ligase n=1 Tax=Carbonactinospora thermoautotrophica TaxID=1469144 RepID=UPI002270F1F3|nr:AMP-dependent synthetase/ligase [Carbonactinospora thermoautotrophica]MCX9190829.1 long-chain fatty acid--CoA ligase [Carbonactinospora thermoautotrophica]
MREYSVPPMVEAPTGNLTDLIVTNAAEAPDQAVFARRVDDRWQDVTARDFLAEVTAVAKGLVATGVKPGDRVGLLSRTRYEWTLFDFAIWSAGGVVVPIYETSSPEQIEWILADSGTTAVIVETADHLAAFQQIRAQVPGVERVWQIDEGAVDVLVTAGRDVPDAEIEQRRATLTPDSLATIIYTSGTTGRPKGCELTHGNFLFELGQAVTLLKSVFQEEDASTLLFLPLAHVFARIIEIGCVMARAKLAHASDTKKVVEYLGEYKPTFILSVPRVFEKVYNSASQKAHTAGKGKIFDAAAATAIAYSEALDRGGPGLGLRLKHAMFDRLVYGKLRAALGGQARWAISGGAPLGERLGHFFRGIGLNVLEGYGLTETTAAVCVNSPNAVKIGTVGRPLPGVAVRIAEDGEILVKGGIVFRGYWHNEQATKEAIDDEGWFHTGDIGELDADGYLRITGRKKEILVTAGGKNVAPAVLEDRVRAHPLISQCMVVGDGQPYIAALVTIDEEMLPAWKTQHGKPADATVADLIDDPDLIATVQEAIDEGNKAVSRAEAIKKFRILPHDFTQEGGELTPSLKLKRNVVAKQYAAEISALYS